MKDRIWDLFTRHKKKDCLVVKKGGPLHKGWVYQCKFNAGDFLAQHGREIGLGQENYGLVVLLLDEINQGRWPDNYIILLPESTMPLQGEKTDTQAEKDDLFPEEEE